MKIARRAFVARMVFAGLATWFKDLPLPSFEDRESLGVFIPPGKYEMRFERVKPGLGYIHWNGTKLFIHEGNTE